MRLYNLNRMSVGFIKKLHWISPPLLFMMSSRSVCINGSLRRCSLPPQISPYRHSIEVTDFMRSVIASLLVSGDTNGLPTWLSQHLYKTIFQKLIKVINALSRPFRLLMPLFLVGLTCCPVLTIKYIAGSIL